MPLRALLAALVLLVSLAAPGVAKTLLVGPGGDHPSLEYVPWQGLAPGDRVLVLPGIVQTAAVVIAARGTAAAPITVSAAGAEPPVIGNGLIFAKAAHVVIERLVVEKSERAGISIVQGSEDITIRNMILRRNSVGLWMGDGAGGNHRITDNEVSESAGNGLAVDRVANPPGRETVFARNRVFRNGFAGFAITGTRFILEENTIYDNGSAIPGTSGIQLYAGGFQNTPRLPGIGAHNILRYNTIYGNHDTSQYDGNGIEVDRWCDDNEVYYNVIWGNDGAGIIVFNGARNRIFNNTVFGNALDPGRSHAGHAEIAIVGDVDNADVQGNVVKNNLTVATAQRSVGIAVNEIAARRGTELGGNLMHNTAGGSAFFWAGQTGRDAAQWNRLANASPADLVADPMFADPAGPPVGLRPLSGSPALRRGDRLGLVRDRAGTPLPAGQPPSIGAYEPAP